jgi:hypothetical protein
MKYFALKVAALCGMGLTAIPAFAGNKDRTGQAGASELLINPWGRSTGVFGQDAAHTAGLEAMRINIAGLAQAEKTEIGVSYNKFFNNANIGATNAGLAQRLGNAGVLGVNLFSMNYGEIDVRTVNSPSGGIGKYRPQFFNISVGFAREFSNNIQAGASVTFINEQISNVKATGACFDAGVQYTTGARDNFHFGVVLRNVGTNMKFGGEGFSYNTEASAGPSAPYNQTAQTPTESFQLPTYLNIATSYDLYLDANKFSGDDSLSKPKHRLTPMVSFISNSFLNDYIGGGVEYAFRETFMLRGGYRHEQGIMENSFYTGLSAGATIAAPLGNGPRTPRLAVDYSYRPTQRPANGVHAVSLRFMLR